MSFGRSISSPAEPVVQKEKKRHQKCQQTSVFWKWQSWMTTTLPFAIAPDRLCPAEKNLARHSAWMFLDDESKKPAKILKMISTFRQPGGKRARWRKETDIVFYTCCHPGTASQVVGGDTLWSSAHFVNRGEWIWQYQDDVGHSVLIIFKIFAGSAGREIYRPNGVSLEQN